MRCLYCGTIEHLGVEHLVPRARGGLDIDGNVFCACVSCNASKGDRLPSEWRSGLPAEVYELEKIAVFLHPSVKARKSKVVKNKLVPKNEIINIRCTNEQKAVIEKTAWSEGLGASTWLLQLGLRVARGAQIVGDR